MADRKKLARQFYEAFSAGDRDFFEEHLADDLTFSSPPDPELGPRRLLRALLARRRAGQGIEIVRLVESGNEVVVTYELKRP